MPGFNESKYLKKVLKPLTQVTSNIIFVDDGSTDNTFDIASSFTKHSLRHDINLGKGAALKTGCIYAFKRLGADAVILMDSDGQHLPSDLSSFTKSLNEGYEIVLGVRHFRSDMPLVRFLGNKFSSVLINLIFKVYLSDIPSGFKAFTRKAYDELRWESQGYEVETEIAVKIAKSKLKFKEITIETVYLDTDKGFTILDAIRVLLKLPHWIRR